MNSSAVTVTTSLPGSSEQEEKVSGLMNLILGCYLSIPITLLGTMGNLIIILVLTRQKQKDTNTIILLSLACSDFTCIFLQFVRKLGCIMEHFAPIMASYFSSYYTVSFWLTGQYAFTCSVGHITLVGVERYVAVYYPFKASTLISKRKLYVGLAFLYILPAIMISPAYASLEVKFLFDEAVNRTTPQAVFSDYYLNSDFLYHWYQSFNMIFWSLILFSLNGAFVFFLAVSVTRKIRTLGKDRSKLTSSGGKSPNVDVRSTLMSLSITVACLITTCPILGINIYLYVQPEGSSFSLIIYNMEEFVSAINSSINLIIYVSLSPKFNAGLKKLFRCQ